MTDAAHLPRPGQPGVPMGRSTSLPWTTSRSTSKPGEFVAIVGPSGSGKSTMMNILGCLDRPTHGVYRLAGTPVAELDDDGAGAAPQPDASASSSSRTTCCRGRSALDNVATPLLYQGVGRARARRGARGRPSSGSASATASTTSRPSSPAASSSASRVARALVTEPALILADEPTGNLDSHAGAEVMALLRELHRAGRTIVLITHDADVAATADRQVHLLDGRIAA